MINDMYHKLANIAVTYSLDVKKGDRVFIRGPDFSKELLLALYQAVLEKGAHPYIKTILEGEDELFYKYADSEQLVYVDDLKIEMIKEFDKLIAIRADFNTRELAQVPPEKIKTKLGSEKNKKYRNIMEKRVAKGELDWVLMPYPCQAYAQDADMGLLAYTEFVRKALLLDKADPIAEWRKVREEQERLIKYLDNVEDIHVLGDDTDLKLSVKDRKWINCSGDKNLPDGEVYTAPIEDSVNGHIRFTFPGIRYGNEVQNIYLEFSEGRVVNATADKNEEFLKEFLTIENADRIGEFAIGNNYGIQTFTKTILFDEKIGGTMHCALGFGFKQTGSKNEAAVHWDLIKDMKSPGSKIIADGTEIYVEGKWKI